MRPPDRLEKINHAIECIKGAQDSLADIDREVCAVLGLVLIDIVELRDELTSE